MTEEPATLFRLYNLRGDLVYVGVTTRSVIDAVARLRKRHGWAREVIDHHATMTRSYETEGEAKIAARVLIQDRMPRFNKQLNPEYSGTRGIGQHPDLSPAARLRAKLDKREASERYKAQQTRLTAGCRAVYHPTGDVVRVRYLWEPGVWGITMPDRTNCEVPESDLTKTTQRATRRPATTTPDYERLITKALQRLDGTEPGAWHTRRDITRKALPMISPKSARIGATEQLNKALETMPPSVEQTKTGSAPDGTPVYRYRLTANPPA